jgi:hypothetical protein
MEELKPSDPDQQVPKMEKSKPRACFDCEFLSIRKRMLTQAERKMLAIALCGASGSMPLHYEETDCLKDLWEYEIHYDWPCWEGVVMELKHSRDECLGFALYKGSPVTYSTANEEIPPPQPAPLEPTSSEAKAEGGIDSETAGKLELETKTLKNDKSRKGDNKLLEGKDAVCFKTTEEYLGIKSRQRQQLVNNGRLIVVGEGHNKKITTESLRKYCPPENPQ